MKTTLTPPTPLEKHAGILDVSLLGVVDFDAFIGLQELETYQLGEQDGTGGRLILCELTSCLSIGREGSQNQILADAETLATQGIQTRWVSRGGGVFPHAPGQLAIMLLLPIQRLRIGVARYQNLLEDAVLATCQEIKVHSRRIPSYAGIWSNQAQIAYFGGVVKSGVTQFGMYLNVSVHPDQLKYVAPALLDGGSKSIQSLRLAPFQMSQIRECLIRHISGHFGYTSIETSSGHPLLRRSSQRVLIHA